MHRYLSITGIHRNFPLKIPFRNISTDQYSFPSQTYVEISFYRIEEHVETSLFLEEKINGVVKHYIFGNQIGLTYDEELTIMFTYYNHVIYLSDIIKIHI